MQALRLAVIVLVLDSSVVFAQATKDQWEEARSRTEAKLSRVRVLGAAADQGELAIAGALSVLSWRAYPDSFGGEVVVGQVQNVTSWTLSFSRVILNFYNGGAFVGSDYSYVFGSHNGRLSGSGPYMSVLPPGAVGFFKVWTDLPYAGITNITFGSDAEVLALAPVFSEFQTSAVGLSGNALGGTNYSGTVRNLSGSFTTFFTMVSLAGSFGGLINDVDFTFTSGAPLNICGTSSTSGVLPGATVGYSGSFLRPVTAIQNIAIEWDEFGIIPAAQSFGLSGGGGTVSVVGNCAWTATSNVPWISITSAQAGAGDATVAFAVAPNNQEPRTGTMTIAGQTFTVTQAGHVVCTFSVNNPFAGFLPANGAIVVASVVAPSGCGWSATADAPWVTITSGSPGNGSGSVGVRILPNTSRSQRTATISIAGQSFTVRQAARKSGGGDFDGDGRTDLVVYRPDDGGWFINPSAQNFSPGSFSFFSWGLSTDIPLRADFDGDGTSDVVVYRPSQGGWYIRYSSAGYSTNAWAYYEWGLATDVPIVGDFDGDGRTDLAVYRPSDGGWYIRYSSLGYALNQWGYFQWGLATDRPLAADFDGDGRTDLVVYRPSEGGWYIRYSSVGYALNQWRYFQWGLPTDTSMVVDFDGDGRTDLAVYRPSDGGWYIRYSSLDYALNQWGYFQWGLPTDKPLAADFDGDGQADLAVYRPSDGGWYIRYSTLGYALNQWRYFQWGLPTDILLTP